MWPLGQKKQTRDGEREARGVKEPAVLQSLRPLAGTRIELRQDEAKRTIQKRPSVIPRYGQWAQTGPPPHPNCIPVYNWEAQEYAYQGVKIDKTEDPG